jgi:hypothetical protein
LGLSEALTRVALRGARCDRLPQCAEVDSDVASVSPDAVAGALLGATFQRAFASHFLGESRATDEDKRFVRDLVITILEPAYATHGSKG